MYTHVLQYGHWKSFLDFLKRNVRELPDTAYGLLEEGQLKAVESEDEKLEMLVTETGIELTEQFDNYLNYFLEKQPDSCIRCTESLKRTDLPGCRICGLDMNHFQHADEKILKEVKEVIQQTNLARMQAVCRLAAQKYKLNSLDKEARFFNEFNVEFEEKESKTIEELNSMKERLLEQETKLTYLKHRKEQMAKDIELLVSHFKKSDSLYKSYHPTTINHSIRLQSKENFVRAQIILSSTKFPVDLIVAFQKEKPDGRLKDAVCFVFIPYKHWKQVEDNTWEINTHPLLSRKIKGRYHLIFSSLHQNELYLKIDHTKMEAMYFL